MLCSSCFYVFTVKKISCLFQITSISHSKDDISILKTTVLNPIREGLQSIIEGGQFSVNADGKKLIVSFRTEDESICNVNTHVLIVGDLKFNVQILGHENMSSFWCMWCDAHHNTGQNLNASSDFELWMIECINDHRNKIIREGLKDAKDVCGIVDFPLWDFIQPLHFVFPQLHVKIGLVNNALDFMILLKSR